MAPSVWQSWLEVMALILRASGAAVLKVQGSAVLPLAEVGSKRAPWTGLPKPPPRGSAPQSWTQLEVCPPLHGLTFVLDQAPVGVTAAVFVRGRRPFSIREQELAARVAPSALALARAALDAECLAEAFTALRPPLILIAPEGRVIATNCLQGGPVESQGRALLVEPPGDAAGWRLMLLPTAETPAASPADEAVWRAAYALTPAEGAVAAAVMEGDDLRVAAERSGISHHTARDHWKQVLRKVGGRRRGNSQALVVRNLLRLTGCIAADRVRVRVTPRVTEGGC